NLVVFVGLQQFRSVRSHFGTGTAITRPIGNICDYSPHRKPWPLFPQDYSKEGRLKPFFANNVDIPFARARRLKPCPRKATVRSENQTRSYRGLKILCQKQQLFSMRRVNAVPVPI